MKPRYLVFVFACFSALLLIGLYHLEANPPADASIWETHYAKALATARETKKMVLVDFTGSDWCPDCKRLEKEVFSTDRFQNYAKDKFVLFRADFPRHLIQSEEVRKQNEALQKEYDQHVYPTIAILNSEGKRIIVFPFETGSADQFMKTLEDAYQAGRNKT